MAQELKPRSKEVASKLETMDLMSKPLSFVKKKYRNDINKAIDLQVLHRQVNKSMASLFST